MSKSATICLVLALLVPALVLAAPGRRTIGGEGGPSISGRAPAPQQAPRPAAPQPQPQPQPQPRHVIGQEPGQPHVSPQPYTRTDRSRDHYSYPSPNRAYEYRPHHDDHHDGYHPAPYHPYYYGNWGWGWGTPWYDNRYYWPGNVVVEVPGPTVYVPVPTEPAPATTGPAPIDQKVDPETLPLLGCDITSGDGKFLGTIDREYDSPESIANQRGAFGDRGSEVSIWNPAGKYGSPTSDYSPWNPAAQYPPMLTWHGAFKGYLTLNEQIKPAISPEALTSEIQAAPWR